jgi:hypothetical protein
MVLTSAGAGEHVPPVPLKRSAQPRALPIGISLRQRVCLHPHLLHEKRTDLVHRHRRSTPFRTREDHALPCAATAHSLKVARAQV